MLIAGIILGFMIVWLLYGYLSHHHLVTTRYTIPTDGKSEEHTFVVLSDLHCCYHGKENEKLLNRIRQENPDFILIPGDMVTKHLSVKDEKVQRILRLLKQLCKEYSVYYSPGNHEIRLNDYSNYMEELSHIGIRYVSNQEMFFPDEGIRLYGLDIPIDYYRSRDDVTVEDLGSFLKKKKADPSVKNILLAHDPRYFKAYVEWGADLTVSGHLHGGILRLPFLGGVFSPYLRFFPKYSGGKYEMDGKYMVVSRGLGTHHLKFRWFNPPEIVVIRFSNKE